MLVQLSGEEGLPETAVKAWKRPFMTAVSIISHLYHSSPRPHMPEENIFILIEKSTGHVQGKNPIFGGMTCLLFIVYCYSLNNARICRCVRVRHVNRESGGIFVGGGGGGEGGRQHNIDLNLCSFYI